MVFSPAEFLCSRRQISRGKAFGPDENPRLLVRLTDQTFTCKTHSGAPRLSGAPLAAMHEVLTLSICKRRDAVRLGRVEAARPPGAASASCQVLRRVRRWCGHVWVYTQTVKRRD